MKNSATAVRDGVRLPHLSGPAAGIRQAIAAHFLVGCPHIIEIGGAGLPISRFVTHHPESVTVIDPKIEPLATEELNGFPCRLRHIAAKFQDHEAVAVEMPAFEPGTYGLALLGLSLKPRGSHPALDDDLLALAAGARTIVIDYALQLGRANEQIPTLLNLERHDIVVDMNMRLNDASLADSPFRDRRLIVLSSQERDGA